MVGHLRAPLGSGPWRSEPSWGRNPALWKQTPGREEGLETAKWGRKGPRGGGGVGPGAFLVSVAQLL